MVAEAGKGLTGPFPTAKVIRGLDKRTHVLRVVAQGPGGVPICKVFDLAAEEEAAAAREEREKEREREKKARYKIIEVGWGIAENDLGMKMAKMRKFLEDGCRVEVVLVRKRGGKRVAAEECEGLVDMVKGAVMGVEGAKEAKPRDGEVGKSLRMYIEKVEKK